MKKSTLIVFCVLLVGKVFAQTSDSLSPTRLRYEVATDLLWLIDKNNVPRTSIFFRYNFRNRPQALRFRIGTENKKEDFRNTVDDSLAYGLSPNLTYTRNIQVGYEWQEQMKSWQCYYGIDVGYQYGFKKYIVEPFSIPNLQGLYSDEFTTRTNMFSLEGFLGMKYFITSKISISSELKASVSYSKSKYKQEALLSQAGVKILNTIHAWQVRFNPIHVLQFSYHF